VDLLCPAVGQGALAIETRDDGGAGMLACLVLNDADTNAAITAERGVLEMLGGGCQVPVGAYATIAGGRLHLRAIVIAPDGTRLVRREADGPVSEALRIGREMGRELLESGGREILQSVAG
jgi:Porphobilinogen deaminase